MTRPTEEILAEVLAALPRQQLEQVDDSVLLVKIDDGPADDECRSETYLLPRSVVETKVFPVPAGDRVGRTIEAALRAGQNVLIFDARGGAWDVSASRVFLLPDGGWEAA